MYSRIYIERETVERWRVGAASKENNVLSWGAIDLNPIHFSSQSTDTVKIHENRETTSLKCKNVSGIVNWCSHGEKHYGDSSKS